MSSLPSNPSLSPVALGKPHVATKRRAIVTLGDARWETYSAWQPGSEVKPPCLVFRFHHVSSRETLTYTSRSERLGKWQVNSKTSNTSTVSPAPNLVLGCSTKHYLSLQTLTVSPRMTPNETSEKKNWGVLQNDSTSSLGLKISSSKVFHVFPQCPGFTSSDLVTLSIDITCKSMAPRVFSSLPGSPR